MIEISRERKPYPLKSDLTILHFPLILILKNLKTHEILYHN